MAVAALVLGLVAIVFCWVPYLSIPCGIVALVLGIIQINKTKKTEEKKGKGMSIAGIITGAIGTVISIIIIIITMVMVAKAVKTLGDFGDSYYGNSYSSGYDYDDDYYFGY